MKSGSLMAVARFLFENGVDDKLSDLKARFAPAKRLAYVVIVDGEQTST